MSIGGLLLAGGESRRMRGRNKAVLRFHGKTFAEHIAGELAFLDECLLSVRHAGEENLSGAKIVEDIYVGCGPMAGIHAALCACTSDALLVVGCDMPLFTAEFGRYLCSAYMRDNVDVVYAVERTGRKQPLCAVYAKSVAAHMEALLQKGECRLMALIEKLSVKEIPLEGTSFLDAVLTNVNTPEDFEKLCKMV